MNPTSVRSFLATVALLSSCDAFAATGSRVLNGSFEAGIQFWMGAGKIVTLADGNKIFEVAASKSQMKDLSRELKVRLGVTALWHRLEQLGLSYKKTRPAAEQNRPDVARARAQWQSRQPSWPIAKLVFLDETGLNTKMTRLYG